MKNSLNLFLCLIVIFIAFPLFGQLEKQAKNEKAYIQTDKPMYRPGDEIWIKALIVNGANQPSILSQTATLEMVKPDGSKMFSKDILLDNGSITEYVKLDKDISGGIYQLKVKTSWMTLLNESFEYSKEIVIQNYDPPRLLMKIDLEKEAYGKGESVNASFNVKDLKDRAIADVGVEFTLFIEGEATQKLFPDTDKNGKTDVDFILPVDINSSNVSINAKLSYRGQVESISKRVPIILENIDLQFLPEGGNVQEDYPNVMAFKALSETGDPADVSGEILDASGKKITDFKSVHDGMGKVIWAPTKGEKYFAKICSPYESSSLIPINYHLSKDVKLTVIKRSESKLTVQVIGNINQEMKVVLSNIYDEIWSTKINKKTHLGIVTIPIEKLPQGIHKISLHVDKAIINERLVFLHPERQMQVSIDFDKDIYGLREKVTADIKTLDFNGKPVSADLGLAVIEDKMLSFADDKQAYITTELLLSSELKGEIYEPNYYFDSITSETNEHLDLVMLTHGWRTYLTSVSDEEAFAHFIDQNSYIGQVIDGGYKNGIKAKVMVQEWNKKQVSILETDEEGYFMLPFYKDKSFTVFAKAEKSIALIKNISMNDLRQKKSKKYKAMKEKWKDEPKFIAIEGLAAVENEMLELKEEAILEEDFEEEVSELNVSLDAGQLLEEVVVTGHSAPLVSLDVTTSGATVTAEAIRGLPTRSVSALAGTTAGISVVNGGAISIRGSRSGNTVYYVDGVRVSNLIPHIMEDRDVENNIFNRNYNKTFNTPASIPVKRQYVNSTYTKSNTKQFYIPQYVNTKTEIRSDFRQTLYWNPSIQTDKNGKATISFYTSDEITSFSMIAEGVTADGQIGRGLDNIVCVKPLNIDCKLPSYFVLGDTAQLSIVVNNDSDKDQKITLDVKALGLKIDYDKIQNTKIKKGKSSVFHLQVVPVRELQQTDITISVTSNNEQDVLSKYISVLNPYFPQQLSYSGVDSDTFDLQLHSPITNTISAKFQTFNPINGALEGIESLLRQPGGCFEQTSSSTYPNVMVYQYLQRDKIANKASMDKAMEYIKKGYKRLAGFETTEDGFEWFGNAPAHVALTAYGLLEFTDMAKIYPKVDTKMLIRTVDFLLSKKDEKGGFTNRRGMDGFGTVQNDVQTAYVLYALSNQTIKKVDVQKEYAAAKKHANKTKDLYLTALMANTAKNLNKSQDYELFISRIINEVGQTPLTDITCQHTITRSGQKDKNIETLSLCALALMKGDDSNKSTVLRIINHIISNRKGGRFGSTQATCLAIQAILSYADWNPVPANEKESIISINLDGDLLAEQGKKIDVSNYITKNNHHMEVTYSNPSSKSYEMTVNYMSKIPPSIDNPELGLSTRMVANNYAVADQVSMEVILTNNRDRIAANPTIILGLPSGMSVQMNQLKELKDAGQIAYFELFNNRLVLYFNELTNLEERRILLDLKADIAGKYIAPSSCAYPYYDDQNRTWIKGVSVKIDDNTKAEIF